LSLKGNQGTLHDDVTCFFESVQTSPPVSFKSMALHEVVWVKPKNQLYLADERQAFIPTDTWH